MYIFNKREKHIIIFSIHFFLSIHTEIKWLTVSVSTLHMKIPPSRAFPAKFVENARDFRLYPRMCRNQSESNEKFAENIVL